MLSISLLGPEGRKQLRQAHRVSSVGIELVLAICLGYYGGAWLDETFDTTPYLSYVGFAFGLVAGFKGLYDFARRTNLDKIDG